MAEAASQHGNCCPNVTITAAVTGPLEEPSCRLQLPIYLTAACRLQLQATGPLVRSYPFSAALPQTGRYAVLETTRPDGEARHSWALPPSLPITGH